jgi:hypothetical protein
MNIYIYILHTHIYIYICVCVLTIIYWILSFVVGKWSKSPTKLAVKSGEKGHPLILSGKLVYSSVVWLIDAKHKYQSTWPWRFPYSWNSCHEGSFPQSPKTLTAPTNIPCSITICTLFSRIQGLHTMWGPPIISWFFFAPVKIVTCVP